MKYKKLLALVLVMSLWGGTMIFADSAAQKIKVVVNGSELEDAAAFLDGKTYITARQIANTLQALVLWDEDTKQVTVYKPNVHMFLFQGEKIFGNVVAGKSPVTFKVFAQIDNLRTSISGVKVSIFDPAGNEQVIQSDEMNENKDNFWYRTKDISYSFDNAGKYTIRFFMQIPESDEWKLVSEKTITAQPQA